MDILSGVGRPPLESLHLLRVNQEEANIEGLHSIFPYYPPVSTGAIMFFPAHAIGMHNQYLYLVVPGRNLSRFGITRSRSLAEIPGCQNYGARLGIFRIRAMFLKQCK